MLRNTADRFGIVNILVHWVVAISIIAMFCFGWWMVDLDYYHAWYKKGPDLHRSIGVVILAVMLLRLGWRLFNPPPAPLKHLKPWERISASIIHWAFYLLVPCIAISGYLITTADGRGLLVFNWLEIPALITSIEQQEDVAGDIHWYLAITIISLATLHMLAALKHHLIDKDQTLKRMLGIDSSSATDSH